MSLADIDPVLAAPKRLAAIGLARQVKEVEFAFIRDQLGLGDSDLSKQMAALVQAGYLTSRKTGKAKTRRTWFAITKAGVQAMDRHVQALNALAAGSNAVAQTPREPTQMDGQLRR